MLEPIRKEARALDGPITYSNYATLVQASAAFHEALRLHPSVPKNGMCTLMHQVTSSADVLHRSVTTYASVISPLMLSYRLASHQG